MIRTKINRQVAKSVLIALFPVAAFAGASAFGQGCPPRFTENFDGVTPPVLPSGWMASQGVNVAGAPIWGTSTITPDTPPNDVFSTAPDNILDNRLQVGLFAGSYDNTVSFRQTYNLEDGFDGAVLEVSIPYINGGAFTDITDPAVGGSFFSGGYNRTISTAFQSPIAGRMAWSGNSGGYITTLAFLGARIVDTTFVTLRFRLATDNRVASTGWRIDTFVWNHNECPPPTSSPTPVPTPNPTPTPCPSSWSAGPSLPTGVARSAGVYFSGNGRFYALGGHGPGAAGSELIHPLEYDPDAATWTIKAATFPDAQVNDMACGLLVDSGTLYIYCVGGSAAGATTAANRVFRYNPLADTISGVAAPWPGNSGGDTLPGGFTVLQNKLYLLGGFQIDTAMTNQIWEFTPGTNAWVQKSAVLPVALGYIPTTTIGNLIYTAGGSRFIAPGTLDDSTNAYFYNPAADVITPIANILRATAETRAVTMNNQMWVLGGGRTAPNPSSEVDIYDPVTGLWTTGPSFATARRNFPAANDGGSRIWLGGGCATDCAAPLDSMEIFQCSSPTPTATPPAATPTPTPTATPTPTPTVTPTATPTPTPVSISGTVLYCSNPVPGPVPNATLALTGTMSGFTSSDSSGNYTFSSLPSGGNYTVTPAKAARMPGSANINSVDVIATQRHFLVLGTPLSGCRLTAADVNGDAAINTVDVVAIQRFFLGRSTGIANVGKYKFTPVNRTYTGIVGNQTGQNYDTLVFGDVAAPFVEP